jgi:hypothetical protein
MPLDDIDLGDHDAFLADEHDEAMGYSTECRVCGCELTDDGYCHDCEIAEDNQCRD